MDPERFDRLIGRRLANDPELAGLLARLGPRLALAAGPTVHGHDHVADLGVPVTGPVRIHARLELTGAPGYLQAFRLAVAPVSPQDPVPEPESEPEVWLAVLDATSAQRDRWVRSTVFGPGPGEPAQRLGYQGWWRYDDAPARTDAVTHVVAHARHHRGHLLWIGSRTNLETPGERHKEALVAVLAID